MKISEEEKNHLEEIYQTFFHDEMVLKMKEVPLHRGSNCYLHSFLVAKRAIKNALRHKSVDLEAILIASILHDYYLYDWRKDPSLKKKHGSRHPFIAALKAKADFEISEKVQRIIESHMWPINIRTFPNSLEARIVSIADKYIASKEALTSKKYKNQKMDSLYKKIEHLFD